MTDKFISPCSQPELLEAMAKARRDNDGAAVRWEHLSDGVKALEIADMKAALEILKNPPEEFLEAMVVRVYRKINMCSEKETMQAALIAAINQTLKEGE